MTAPSVGYASTLSLIERYYSVLDSIENAADDLSPPQAKLLKDQLHDIEIKLREAAGAFCAPASHADIDTAIWDKVVACYKHCCSNGFDREYLLASCTEAEPLTIPLEVFAPTSGSLSAKDASEDQAARDIQRDVLVINGVTFKGQEHAYAGILEAVEECIRQHENMITTTPASAREIVKELLRRGNRTVSGGDSFEAISLMLHPKKGSALHNAVQARAARSATEEEAWVWGGGDREPEEESGNPRRAIHSPVASDVVLVAQPLESPPIKIDISVGLFTPAGEDRNWRFGLRAELSAVTVYRLYDDSSLIGEEVATSGAPPVFISAAYKSRLGWIPASIDLDVHKAMVKGEAVEDSPIPAEILLAAVALVDGKLSPSHLEDVVRGTALERIPAGTLPRILPASRGTQADFVFYTKV